MRAPVFRFNRWTSNSFRSRRFSCTRISSGNLGSVAVMSARTPWKGEKDLAGDYRRKFRPGRTDLPQTNGEQDSRDRKLQRGSKGVVHGGAPSLAQSPRACRLDSLALGTGLWMVEILWLIVLDVHSPGDGTEEVLSARRRFLASLP